MNENNNNLINFTQYILHVDDIINFIYINNKRVFFAFMGGISRKPSFFSLIATIFIPT